MRCLLRDLDSLEGCLLRVRLNFVLFVNLDNFEAERWLLDLVFYHIQRFFLGILFFLLIRVVKIIMSSLLAVDITLIHNFMILLRVKAVASYLGAIRLVHSLFLRAWPDIVAVYVSYGRLISHIFYLLLIIWIIFLFIGYFI